MSEAVINIFVYLLLVLPVQGKLVLQHVTQPCANQKSVFMYLAATSICCKTDLNIWVVKRATLLFDTFCAMQNVAKQVARCFGPFYPGLTYTSTTSGSLVK